MTKKQYRGKMIQLRYNLDKTGKAAGCKPSKSIYKVPTPNWGTQIDFGKHAGEILTSYEQAWDILSETLGKTPAFEGIK